MTPLQALNTDVLPMFKPPSAILKEYFDMYNEASLTPAVIEEAARKVLLPPAKVKMWFNHLASVERMQGKRQHKLANRRQRRNLLHYSTVVVSVMMCTKSTPRRWRTGFVVMIVAHGITLLVLAYLRSQYQNNIFVIAAVDLCIRMLFYLFVVCFLFLNIYTLQKQKCEGHPFCGVTQPIGTPNQVLPSHRIHKPVKKLLKKW